MIILPMEIGVVPTMEDLTIAVMERHVVRVIQIQEVCRQLVWSNVQRSIWLIWCVQIMICVLISTFILIPILVLWSIVTSTLVLVIAIWSANSLHFMMKTTAVL